MNRIGIWTNGVDDDIITGPFLAVKRMLLAMDDIDHNLEFACMHHNECNDEIYDFYDDVVIEPSLFRGGLFDKLVKTRNLSATLEVSLPGSLRNFVYDCSLGETPMKYTWIHGTSNWLPEQAYGDRLTPEGFTERWRNQLGKTLQQHSISRYEGFIANSNFTKEVMIDEVGIPRSDIDVIHLGVDHQTFREHENHERVRSEFNIDSPFILFVGNNTPRKQPSLVINVFEQLYDSDRDVKLVIVGGRYENSKLKRSVENSEYGANVTFTGYIPERMLAELYSAAEMFVFPTLHETFGMPILEAMASGCPVISSDCTAVPEISGRNAVMISDPTDPDELFNAIVELLDDVERRERLCSQGKCWAEQFTWHNCAQEFVELFETA